MFTTPTANNPNVTFYYDFWKKKISILFFLLSTYSTILFSIHENIPIDIIKYILILYLKIEQNQLKPDQQCPCSKKKCIRKWWALSYFENDMELHHRVISEYISQAYYIPKHCNNIDGCHKIFDSRFKENNIIYQFYCNSTTCGMCLQKVCEDCCEYGYIHGYPLKSEEVDWIDLDIDAIKYGYFFICRDCLLKRDENPDYVFTNKFKCFSCDKYVNSYEMKSCWACYNILCNECEAYCSLKCK